MSTLTLARKTMRRGVAAAITSAMLVTTAPAYAQVTSDNDIATAITGNGGSVGIAANVVALTCLLLVPSCGTFGGGNATGGNSGPATATTAS